MVLANGYKGCNGLKTGTTDKAGHCLCATAKRNNMRLIAVALGCKDTKDRVEVCRTLLDYGFAHYKYVEINNKDQEFESLKVLKGKKAEVKVKTENEKYSILMAKDGGKVEQVVEMDDSIEAPVEEGQEVGKIIYKLGEKTVGEQKIVTAEKVEKINFTFVLGQLFGSLLG